MEADILNRRVWLSFALTLSFLPMFIASSGPSIIPLPAGTATFSVTANSAMYQAFLTIGVTVTQPLFAEANFTKLMYDDIELSPYCLNGCTITLERGNYNQTQKIPIMRPGIAIFGTPASIIYPQATFNTPVFNVSGSSFVFNGARIDDFARRFVTGSCGNLAGTLCHIPIVIWSSSCKITDSQIFNATTVLVYLTIQSSGCLVSGDTLVGIPAQFSNSSLGVMQGIEASGKNHVLDSNIISYIRGGAGIRMGAGTTNNALYSRATGNTLFHNEYGLSSVRGLYITMADNTIYNSTSVGILLDTGIAAPTVWGPISISGGTISESTQGLCCGVSPGAANGGHILLQGTRCCWYGVTIVGVSMLDRQSNMTTPQDILIGTQSYVNLTIVGNALGKTRNQPEIKLSVTPLSSWIIHDNPGYNPQSNGKSSILGKSWLSLTNKTYVGLNNTLVVPVTPTISGSVQVCISASVLVTNSTTSPRNSTIYVALYRSTNGTMPLQAKSITSNGGTQLMAGAFNSTSTFGIVSFCHLSTGLTRNTIYYFYLAVKVDGGTGSIYALADKNIGTDIVAVEV